MFPTRSGTNKAVQARGLKILVQKVEGEPYLCSENKGVDQLHNHSAADQRLCFSHMQKSDFLTTRIMYASPCDFTAWPEILPSQIFLQHSLNIEKLL